MGLEAGLHVEVGLCGQFDVDATCVSLSAALARFLLMALSRLSSRVSPRSRLRLRLPGNPLGPLCGSVEICLNRSSLL